MNTLKSRMLVLVNSPQHVHVCPPGWCAIHSSKEQERDERGKQLNLAYTQLSQDRELPDVEETLYAALVTRALARTVEILRSYPLALLGECVGNSLKS